MPQTTDNQTFYSPEELKPKASDNGTFISTNRLKELFQSDPRLAQSREAQKLFIRRALERGNEVEGLNAKFNFGDAVANFIPDVVETGKAIAHMLTSNPLQTIEGISSVARGALRKVLPDPVFTAGAKLRQALPDALGGTDLTPEQQKEQDNAALGTMADLVVENFGSVDRTLNTIEKHPAQFLSTIATLGEGAALKGAQVGAKAGLLSNRAANVLTQTAEVMNRTAQLGDPVAIAMGTAKLPFKAIKAANEAVGLNKLIRSTDVNEKMIAGLHITPGERLKMATKLKTGQYGEELAKMGVTGTLQEMSEQAATVSKTTQQIFDQSLGKVKGSYKVKSADNAIDQLFEAHGGDKAELSNLFKPPDEKVLQTINLTPSETYRIVNKTQTKDIGKRLTAIGVEPDDTIATVAKKVSQAANESKTTLDNALAGITTRYTTPTAQKVLDNLKKIRGSVPYTELAKPLQKEHNRIVQLLVRNENKGLTLSELNETKRLLDDIASDKAFTLSGDIKTSTLGRNLSELRSELRSTIEKNAAKGGVKNVRGLNNDTQFAQEVKHIIDKKIKSGLPKEKVKSEGKFTAAEFQQLRADLKELRIKNKEAGLSVSELNKLDDSIESALQRGVSGGTKQNLEALQKNIREVVEYNAKKQGIANIGKLRDQKNFADTFKSLIDTKIAKGGDQAAKAATIGKQATQIFFQEFLYRSKLGKVYGAFKGAKGLFQTLRGPQFQRDLATAIQLLKDKEFKTLEGGFKLNRPATKLETKMLAKQGRRQMNENALKVLDGVIQNLSKAYPTLRGLRLTGQVVQQIRMPEQVVTGSAQP